MHKPLSFYCTIDPKTWKQTILQKRFGMIEQNQYYEEKNSKKSFSRIRIAKEPLRWTESSIFLYFSSFPRFVPQISKADLDNKGERILIFSISISWRIDNV